MSSIQVLRTELRRTVTGLRDSIKTKGLAHTSSRVIQVGGAQFLYPLTRMLRQGEGFNFQGTHLPYTFARYNNSFLNERSVEISIAKWFLATSGGGRVLEVGNVLMHYGIKGHTVVDRYEAIPGVINDDIVDFAPEKPFDTVVSISTLEHVGWDETPREPERVFRAIENVKKCASAAGRILVTIPLGYNKTLDAGLRSSAVSFPQEVWLVRKNRRNEWGEGDKDAVLSMKYGQPYTGANGLYIGMT